MGYGGSAVAEIKREQGAQSGFCCHRNHVHPRASSSMEAYRKKFMRVPYGPNKEYFKYSLFLVFCNRITTSFVAAGVLLFSLFSRHIKNAVDPVAPLYKYCVVSVAKILTTRCQYEALKYVSFPVQTLAKCAKMIPVMVATISQFFISYTIRNFGALTFATIMTTRQFSHPLTLEPGIGAVVVLAFLYAKSFLNIKRKSLSLDNTEKGTSSPLKENP
ncbi:UDP-galactose UDP-glucose transporter 5B [Olea europaea subsp. europaea]|uniref:UDP-galactose UDP-glucose transporter 5B n=1 Tax=Olea europaea subsp. europaea TaxID=158383 RepID=A0A8S0V6V3_OLEEU|nr:UDP-galactose UDP-glucose transporter 5B [Olea europaea subsp. europaea]